MSEYQGFLKTILTNFEIRQIILPNLVKGENLMALKLLFGCF